MILIHNSSFDTDSYYNNQGLTPNFVEKTGHPATEVARYFGISCVGVLLSVKKGHDICQKYDGQLNLTTT